MVCTARVQNTWCIWCSGRERPKDLQPSFRPVHCSPSILLRIKYWHMLSSSSSFELLIHMAVRDNDNLMCYVMCYVMRYHLVRYHLMCHVGPSSLR